MSELNLLDLAKTTGLDSNRGRPDWSKTLQRALMAGVAKGSPLVPNGTHDEPTIVRIPEMLHAVSTYAPYMDGLGGRRYGKHIHIIADKGAGFYFSTLGRGHDGAVERDIERAMKDPEFCIELEKGPKDRNGKRTGGYRSRAHLAPVGGHGMKIEMTVIGPKTPGMPWRSPSGRTKEDQSKNCLEGQHAFNGKDFGKHLTEAERAAGVHGYDLSGCDFGWVWGDALSPGTIKPNDKPNEGLFVAGSYFHDLGRIGLLMNGVLHAHLTYCVFGNGIPSSILHAETSSNAPNLFGDITLDRSVIQSGRYTVHVSGEMAELDGLTVNSVTRRDAQHAVFIDGGPKLTKGPRAGQMRCRNITFTGNVHERWGTSGELGNYQNVSDLYHTGNSGPYGTPRLSDTLHIDGQKKTNIITPNRYWPSR
jgi:hypothetical protein